MRASSGTTHVAAASLGWFSPVTFLDVEFRDPNGRTVLHIPKVESERILLRLVFDRVLPELGIGLKSMHLVPDRPEPIVLDRHSAGLQLLQRISDEAHRFALGFHRQRRDSKVKESIFDTLQGVGPARRRTLLQHFGSAERFLAASQEELEGVPGIPERTARSIYAQLHKAGRA